MFSAKEIELMRSLELEIDYESPSDEDIVVISEKVSGALERYGFDGHYRVTECGKICESILDKISDI